MTNKYTYLGIEIHKENPEYINEFSSALLDGFYVRDDETIPEALARAATAFCYGNYDLAQRIYNYAYNGWFMFASPILSNAPKGKWLAVDYPVDWKTHKWVGDKSKSMPISCFALYVDDTLEGQFEANTELSALSVAGGGVGMHNGIRAAGDKSSGVIPFAKTMDALIGYYKQGKVRRGACAMYMDVNHPDIVEHIKFRIPTGGDSARKADNRKQYHNAVNITQDFIDAVNMDKPFDLVCPHTKEVRETLKARDLWETILETRVLTGEPYIFKIDTANEALPKSQKDKGLSIKGSNICVAPETKILTDKGELEIQTLENTTVNVWNGEQWSEVTVVKTSEKSDLISVKVSLYKNYKYLSTNILEATPYHNWYTNLWEKLRTFQLTKGVWLESWEDPDGNLITSVVDSLDECEMKPTYCFKEPLRGRGVFNGILTGQCIEITLPTDKDRSFVCCLSSTNLAKYYEWKDSEMIQDLTEYLDNVLEYYIENAPKELYKSVYSAKMERAIGIGAMGLHTLYQNEGITFDSDEAFKLNKEIFENIQTKAEEATYYLGALRGEPEDMKGTGRRNSNLIAIAPNSNNSIILGVSASIEPINTNAYSHSTRAGTFLVKNKNLEKVLRKYQDEDGWIEMIFAGINKNKGSVQHLDFLSEDEKRLFLTAVELDQNVLVDQADDRAKYICQSQSLNLFFPKGVDEGYMNRVHLNALNKKYLKGLYYCRMNREVSSDTVRDIQRNALKDFENDSDSGECTACHA